MTWQVLPEYPIGTIGMTCFVCNSDLRDRSGNRRDGHERAFDTGVNVEFEGRAVLCESCVVEVGRMAGMIPEAKVDELRKNNRELGLKNRRLVQDLETAKSAIKGLREVFNK